MSVHIKRGWRAFFGPYPLLMICTWVCKTGLVKDRSGLSDFVGKLRKAAIEGELEFYGRLIAETGIERNLTRIPPAQLAPCAIHIDTSRSDARAANGGVFTYDSKRGTSKPSPQIGQYCDLHVGRKVLRITMRLSEDAQQD